ncbi:glycosyltransferase 25 family member [Galleria mellonella]|uniref:Glycosyltransferase 25 family member n=1 Tax=Galleria mellonella TaxID=7137 RepID=A0A6J1WXT6_GALME|nr:glycosyltransferase 25 family member [Galleria mellonella]
MRYSVLILFLCFITFNSSTCYEDMFPYKWPTIGISVLIRNKGHTLPYFLTCLYNLDYPKDRLYLWMYSDYNEDDSIKIIEKWAEKYASEYNGVYITTNSSGRLHPDEKSATHWSKGRFKHIIRLREESLDFAKKMWADYLFMVDADVFLTEKSTLKALVSKNMTVVSPMLKSDGLYSNFWCGMTEKFYYQRTEDYEPILSREKQGCFEVPMVNTAVLVSLRRKESDLLTYDPRKVNNYKGPDDDIIAFAISAKINDISLNICNDRPYGFILVPLEESDEISKDYEQLLNIKLEAVSRKVPLPLDNYLEEFVSYPKPWKFKCSEIYMINLERRTERRELMEMSFKELGIDAKLFKAIDGMKLDLNDLREYSITLMPGYEDPYHKRPMKAGEVGCFLSHYYIWKEIVEKHHSTALVLEDDVHFIPYFRHKFLRLLDEIKNIDWDLVYIGRKILLRADEKYVTDHTTRPLYSYWTLGYLISERGARKLLDAQPLSKMLPVDEFLPIMFDQHPNDTWKAHFSNRNLVALSAAPLLVYPTHYTGDEGYISDTEDSNIVDLGELDYTVKHEL